MLRILYLVHDLSDPAVARRVAMLQAGGADVVLAGFRRGGQQSAQVCGVAPIELGLTEDGRFAQRLLAVARAAWSLGVRLGRITPPDIIIGRNLEMLALANRARHLFGAEIPIVYECLDIHRLMLRQDAVGKALRQAEKWLASAAVLLMTSSPAFVREYFQPLGQVSAPVALLHNKVLELEARVRGPVSVAGPKTGDPWKIGWFGALRCRKSLDLLAAFTREMNGRFEIVLRGRPAYREFPDFDGFVEDEPHLRFAGPYRNPDELAAIYGEVHFTWAIDFFEEGANSRWLLPNRLYEGCRYGAVPIAMADTETGRFLADRDMGLLLVQPSSKALASLLGGITSERYSALRNRILIEDRSTWLCDIDDCRALVGRLERLACAFHAHPIFPAAA